jgi:hypothetical protein
VPTSTLQKESSLDSITSEPPNPSEGPLASKRDAVYRYFKPCFEFTWRIALDTALAQDAVNRAFAESFFDIDDCSAKAFRDRLFARAAHYCILGRKGSHFQFAVPPGEQEEPFPFPDRALVRLVPQTNFTEAFRRIDIASRAVCVLTAEGLGGESMVLGLDSDGVTRRAEGALVDLCWAFDFAEAPQSCGAFDLTDFRRRSWKVSDPEWMQALTEHLNEPCKTCQALHDLAMAEQETLRAAFGSIAVPELDTQKGMRDILSIPGEGAGTLGVSLPLKRISRELGILIAAGAALALIVALWGLAEFFYGAETPTAPPPPTLPKITATAPPTAPPTQSLEALLAGLAHPDSRRRGRSTSELVKRGEGVVEAVLRHTDAPNLRTRRAARNVARDIIRRMIARDSEEEVPPLTPADVERRWTNHERFRELSQRQVDALTQAYAVEAKGLERNRLEMLLRAERRLFETLRSVDKSAFKAKTEKDARGAALLTARRKAALGAHIPFDAAVHWLRTGELHVPWASRVRAALTMHIALPDEPLHPLEVARIVEEATGLPVLFDPSIYETVPGSSLRFRGEQVVQLVLRSLTRVGWSYHQAQGCFLLGPAGFSMQGNVLDYLAAGLDDPQKAPYAALALSRICNISPGFAPLESITSERNRVARSRFQTWFDGCRDKLVFDPKTGRFTMK